MTNPHYDAFISYASPDLAFAEEAHSRLTAAGFRVWFDKARLNPGCDWHREIEAACEASRVLLPVLTPRWKLSEWTKFETYGAEAVIPLIVEGELADIFTPPLTRFQGQAVELAASDDAAWQRLFTALRSLLAEPVPDKLARLADVRYAANPYFVGRERELNQIHEELHQNPTAVLTQGRVRAVTALGGVGKTTLARQYLEKFWRCYPQIFWVDCRLGIETEFARLCDLLLPPQRGLTNVVEKAQLALRALESRDDRLLVLDNAENETSIQAWIPKTGHCRTLITSRFTEWSAVIKTVHLYVLEPELARTLLATRAGRESFAALSATEQADCERLARELGYLPLALEQAAAYIEQQGSAFRFADYLRLYATATAELLAAGVLGSTEYPDSVMTTWKATSAKLSPAARGILRLCAFLSATRLPLSVLIEGVEVLRDEAAAVAGSSHPAVSNSEMWVRQQVKQLRAYSMIEGDGQSLAVHPLVQTVERLQLDESSGARKATLKRSLDWINTAFEGLPDDVRTWARLNPLAPHARAVAEHADQAGISDPTARLMNRVGTLLLTKAQYEEAEPLLRRALRIDEQGFGPSHPNVASALNSLALLLKDTNRLSEAEPLMRRTMEITEHSFGPAHPSVASALNNLGQLLQATNRLTEAEPLMRRALAIDEQNFGADHPESATHLNNLAQLLQATNRLSEAEELMRRVLKIDEQSFGPDHPNVATGLSNLATLLLDTNRSVDAEPLLRRALEITEQSFGSDHPRVAICLNNIVSLLDATNRFREAEPLVRRALAIDEQSFGPDHTNVARDLNNLATLLRTMNRLMEAEPLIRKALGINEQSLGPDHPNVGFSLCNLAQLLYRTNRLAEAEPLMKRSLAIEEQSFGPDHPDVATRLNDLAQLLQATNRSVDAEPLMRRALEITERSFGPDHPKVADRLNNLAQLLQHTNRLSEAEPLMKRTLSIYENSLGPAHPRVATALNNLAQLLKATNRLGEAEPLMRRALEIEEQSFGPDHPKVAVQLNNLAQLLQDTKRLSEAEPLMRRALEITEQSFGSAHPNVAISLSNLARLLDDTNRLAEAELLIRRALEIDEQSFGPDHPNVAIRLNNLVSLLNTTNRLWMALPLMRRALEIDEQSFGPEHPNVARDLNNLAQLLQAANLPTEAEPLMRRSAEILLRFTVITGHEHPLLRPIIGSYQAMLRQMGYNEAHVIAELDRVGKPFGVHFGNRT